MKYLIFIIIAILFFGCKKKENLMECQENIVSEALSPDRKFLALLKIRDCGATTAVVQLIQIKKMKGNSIADIYVVRGDAKINFKWIGNQLVVNSEAGEDDIFKKSEGQDGESVLYR